MPFRTYRFLFFKKILNCFFSFFSRPVGYGSPPSMLTVVDGSGCTHFGAEAWPDHWGDGYSPSNDPTCGASLRQGAPKALRYRALVVPHPRSLAGPLLLLLLGAVPRLPRGVGPRALVYNWADAAVACSLWARVSRACSHEILPGQHVPNMAH